MKKILIAALLSGISAIVLADGPDRAACLAKGGVIKQFSAKAPLKCVIERPARISAFSGGATVTYECSMNATHTCLVFPDLNPSCQGFSGEGPTGVACCTGRPDGYCAVAPVAKPASVSCGAGQTLVTFKVTGAQKCLSLAPNAKTKRSMDVAKTRSIKGALQGGSCPTAYGCFEVDSGGNNYCMGPGAEGLCCDGDSKGYCR